jgi:hypothetical protein
MKSYTNPFHSPQYSGSTPVITTDSKPSEYRGYLIYERIRGQVWDIVKDGVCVGMNAGPRGARKRIDEIINPTL